MDLSSPKIMGILNITPDSFYAESRKNTLQSILESAERMLSNGADFLDLGGYSSRPNAEHISSSDEIGRVVPAIEAIKKEFPVAIISIDTFRSEVASASVEAGADLINDISAGHQDPAIFKVAARHKLPFIGMHMQGSPQTMQSLTDYEDILKEVAQYFGLVIEKAKKYGIRDLIIDPGFGFAKTIEQNYYLLDKLSYFKQLDCPILVGVSRKSMIYRLLDIGPEEALNGTTALNMLALIRGADILRVHDVKEARELVKLTEALNGTGI